ncbi:tRNA dimethylallyltransferase [Verrucomicrobium sp. GAS474]|uniref:tRNA (adenosine(37)-N6)-dimethylallyltransferase MiaA n=1 Tax=Verrucomicrobium sp. GAS474 TaxID=1882831 RepID=UPI00087D47FF|nr:tRNA (adenosine(37)-N6)-dimethylallyltransferase MiaA [Verrucomicrobium sp. GAS474]SDU14740.1 tRNA dimethylallyltransferase [Verrucomicrobium sp. GAS474]
MIVFLLGPTGVGKSEVALRLAAEDKGAILSLDSMQVYRGLDIGTGKPTAAEQARIPHGGLDLFSWRDQADVARYVEAAAAFIEKSRGRPLYVVGGTGLYFRALTQGLSEAPPAPLALRAELAALRLAELTARLRSLDPGQEKEASFDWQNPRRVQRALEVLVATGVPLREWQKKKPTSPLLPPGTFRAFLLRRERDELRERIALRVEKMVAEGWIDEVRRLLDEGGPGSLADCAAIGYSLLAGWLERGGSPVALPAVRQEIVDATRQYAKRQLTWFRRESNVETLMIPPFKSSDETAWRVRAALQVPSC